MIPETTPLRPEVQAELDAFREHLTWHKRDSAPDCRFCDERDAKKPAPPAAPLQQREGETHPEAICQHCGGPNVVWFAPNDLWNRVMGGEAGIVCPRCFVLAAEKAGVVEIWRLAPDHGDHRLLDRTYTLTAHGIPLPLTGRQLLANMARAEDALEHPERASSLISGEAATSRSTPTASAGSTYPVTRPTGDPEP